MTIFLSTLYLQQVRALDPLMAGLALLGPSAGAALSGVLSAQLAASRPPLLVMGLTGAVAAVSLAPLAAAGAIGIILGVLAALLLPASAVVLWLARAAY